MNRKFADSCQGKKVYKTLEIAQIAAETQQWKIMSRLRAYKCRFCDDYHIGHPRTYGGSNKLYVKN